MTTPDAEFVLEEPAINSVYLNFALSQNPALTATWIDDVTTSSSYIVEMSLTESFTNVIQLGSTPAKQFTISVADLNEAIRDAGATNFKDIAIELWEIKRYDNNTVVINSIKKSRALMYYFL
jgi:hypothetical protein